MMCEFFFENMIEKETKAIVYGSSRGTKKKQKTIKLIISST